MAKKIVGYIKLQVPAAQANPSPPIGPALGQHGVNIMEFCKAFNARTQGQEGMIIPVVITVFRSVFYLYYQDPAGIDIVKKGRSDRQRLQNPQSGQGRQGQSKTNRRNRQAQNAGLKCQHPGSRQEDH